jgi:glutathionylspermidine synthase
MAGGGRRLLTRTQPRRAFHRRQELTAAAASARIHPEASVAAGSVPVDTAVLKMKRVIATPRPDWQARVEKVGLTYHTPDGVAYWDESAYYEFTAQEIDVFEKAANDLHMMCIEAAEVVINEKLFAQLGIPEQAVPSILKSWERDDFSLYGRFDFAYDGQNPPKLLEYNADTPTSLVEAAVAQWYWLEDTDPKADQFNSIHEHLIAAWQKYKPTGDKVWLGGIKDSLEDEQTVLYIQDTCFQAGMQTKQLFIEDLGYDSRNKRFVDLQNDEVRHYFKLYPWEWMWHEEFSQYLPLEVSRFIEPMWKMLLSNKGLLPVLWKTYEGHENLLPAYFSQAEFEQRQGKVGYVQKPKLSREGANITMVNGNEIIFTQGEYGEEGYIFQAIAPTTQFDGNYPVLGVWVINHEACGMGIREDTTPITGNLSRFIPHLFR